MAKSDFNFPSATGSNNMYCVSDKNGQGHIGVLLDYDNLKGYGQSYMMFYLNYVPQSNNTVKVSIKQVEGTNNARPHSQWDSTVTLKINGSTLLSGTVRSYDLYNSTSETLKSANVSNILYGGTRNTVVLSGIDTSKDISSQISISGSIRFLYVIETVIPTYEKDYRDGWGHDSRSFSGTTTYSHSHSWGNWSITTAATCSSTGSQSRKCSGCDVSQTSTVAIDKNAHQWGAAQKINATCTTEGYDLYTCNYNSSHTYKDNVVPVSGHKYTSININPTCTNQGYTEHKCSVCSHTYYDDYVSALGHKYGEWETTTPPQYQKDGEAQRKCDTCGAIEKKILAALKEALRRALCVIEEKRYITKIATKNEDGSITWKNFINRIG